MLEWADRWSYGCMLYWQHFVSPTTPQDGGPDAFRNVSVTHLSAALPGQAV